MPLPSLPWFALRGWRVPISINHPDTVGVFINLAPDTNIPPEKMGEAISILFKRQGIDTYITSYDGTRGISNITFFIRGTSYPGYTFDHLEKGIIDMAKIHKAEAKLAKLRKEMEGLLETQTELEDAFGNSKN
ncbi:MAG: hypothetical protein O7D86_02935 [Proteobacteria bacterium]|nr:hypothetical protein [Pseudomonadota bacterium]